MVSVYTALIAALAGIGGGAIQYFLQSRRETAKDNRSEKKEESAQLVALESSKKLVIAELVNNSMILANLLLATKWPDKQDEKEMLSEVLWNENKRVLVRSLDMDLFAKIESFYGRLGTINALIYARTRPIPPMDIEHEDKMKLMHLQNLLMPLWEELGYNPERALLHIPRNDQTSSE